MDDRASIDRADHADRSDWIYWPERQVCVYSTQDQDGGISVVHLDAFVSRGETMGAADEESDDILPETVQIVSVHRGEWPLVATPLSRTGCLMAVAILLLGIGVSVVLFLLACRVFLLLSQILLRVIGGGG